MLYDLDNNKCFMTFFLQNVHDLLQDFVVIKDTPKSKKKRLLTEHQKEILKEKK